MKIPLLGFTGQPVEATNIRLRCPSCGRNGTFEPVTKNDLTVYGYRDGTVDLPGRRLGHRRCPNAKCWAHIFFVTDAHGDLVATYPAERIDFDKEGIPNKVIDALEEAVTCHAGKCYTASAIMIRRTLEEVCRDREAKGDSLYKRIEALSDKVVLPRELLEGMQTLRLLGNDAAHVTGPFFEPLHSCDFVSHWTPPV